MSFRSEWHTSAAMYINSSGGSRGGDHPPLFLDENEGQKKFFLRPGPPLSQGLDDRPPPLSDGLNPPLNALF